MRNRLLTWNKKRRKVQNLFKTAFIFLGWDWLDPYYLNSIKTIWKICTSDINDGHVISFIHLLVKTNPIFIFLSYDFSLPDRN